MGLFNIDPLHVAAGPFCGLQPSPFALIARGSRNHQAVLYMRTNNGFAYKGFNATYFAVTDTSKISKLSKLFPPVFVVMFVTNSFIKDLSK